MSGSRPASHNAFNRIIDGAKALAKFPENSGSEHAASIT
jgi:hypothetical protein